jgi:uncharacterized membrane protein
MARLVFFGGVVALIVLILMWDQRDDGRPSGQGRLDHLYSLAIVLLIVGLTVHWE